MSKLDLFKQNWIDTIFEGRNKKYGAYDLRAKRAKVTTISFFIGAILFSSLISIPVISNHLEKKNAEARERNKPLIEEIKVVELETPPEDAKIPENIPQAPPPEMKSAVDVKKFTPPKAVDSKDADTAVTTIKELEKANVGKDNVKGDSISGQVIIDETPAEKPKNEGIKITENTIHKPEFVDVKPSYPGGEAAFKKFIGDNFQMPEVGHSTVIKIYASFVVERDGSLSNIKVLRDAGYGTTAEAIRVLKKCKKWSPGIQGGRPVRTQFMQPITLQIE